jgi:Protein of unknown function (DUF2809)
MLTFNLKSFIIFVALFLIEVSIALFLHDAFIRPFFGDFLAVIGLYFLLKTFIKRSNFALATFSLLFAYLLEALQYVDFLSWAGLKHHKILAIVIGSSFDWGDIWAYTLGFVFILFFENILSKIEMKSSLKGTL